MRRRPGRNRKPLLVLNLPIIRLGHIGPLHILLLFICPTVSAVDRLTTLMAAHRIVDNLMVG
jgi:hypothetical protein